MDGKTQSKTGGRSQQGNLGEKTTRECRAGVGRGWEEGEQEGVRADWDELEP